MSKIITVTSKQQFDEIIANNKKVLVDFKAVWCGPCKMLHPVLEQLASKITDAVIVEVDVDDNKDLALEHKIMSIPAIHIYENQQLKTQKTGFMPMAQLQELLK
ncbi:thioredoxin [Williamsoniiplasma lucivorax]|uniref:Thioredoxin n=1 Tax=Williamsoniiplasma lucivorax TaxID=209274 RepID=A0A2S5RAJ9_9MOLU|nr:thioredoxin [Williamsoniiplasma lucivorax]PPE04145.1 thioredoxin [Williamsoniiplasma lucivorax]